MTMEFAYHSVQYGDQYSPHLENCHVADQLIGERHEIEGADDPCGLVVFDGAAVLQAEADKVSNVGKPRYPVPYVVCVPFQTNSA